MRSKCIVTQIALLVAAHEGIAQTASPPTLPSQDQALSPDAAATSSSNPTAWRIGPLDVSGMIDGYYSLGFNHPAGHVNGLRNFDDKANQVELNMATLTVDYSPKPLGFHLDVGAGRTFDIMGAAEKDVTEMRFFKQAFIDVRPARWKGLELDFGKFASSASAEVIETPNNWNYSRSLLFVWCTPYYHFGFRASTPVGKHFNAGAQLVSGWNNIVSGATFKTVGWTGSWTPTSKITWTNTYYGGPDENKANRGMRSLYDTVLLLSPNSKTNLYINFDYLHDSPAYTPSYKVYGIAAARFQLTRKLSLSQRSEWLNDNTGLATGTGQQVKEFTVTGAYALLDRLSGWLEFRHDWSNQPFFNRGNETAMWKKQPTLLLGMVAIIGPKR
ncbi:MAG TPA: porin [Bryobacteraceae bacterium]|nr:porin [Bryobacteraceae bacterium]